MAEKPKDSRRVADGIRESTERERQTSAAGKEQARPKAEGLLEEVLRRENLITALKRVRSNGGVPGIDGMTVDSLTPYLKAEWPRIREALLDGTYIPQPVRRVEIPKPDGKGVRLLGIPTVLDRLIQQAVLQLLSPRFDPTFSESSYGFRPGRGCHDAVMSAVDRPWNRKFLGYTMTPHHRPRLKIAPQSVKRAKARIKAIVRKGRGCSLPKVIGELTPFLRGWVTYFRRSQVKGIFEELDGWIRRKLRCILWRQWKKPRTRARKMTGLGIERGRALTSAYNGRGPWWNAGASHMNAAASAKWFHQQGLTSLLAEYRRLECLA